jgi:hypothetical protein
VIDQSSASSRPGRAVEIQNEACRPEIVNGEVVEMDEEDTAYLHSSTFWVLVISGPILWALVIYLLAQIFSPGFR